MRARRLVPLVAFVLILSAAALAAQKKVTVVVVNQSAWDIHHLHLSPIDDDTWGPDQLGRHVIAAEGGTFSLTGVPPGDYDVKLIDEDGDECVVEDVDIGTEGHEQWTITSRDLVACQWGD